MDVAKMHSWKNANSGPIGIMDSGVGGLTVLRHIRKQLPHEDLLYFADQAHVPYGPQTPAKIKYYTQTITAFLLDQGAKLIVVACNAASAAALTHLRESFPEVSFVGMEPAVKPGATQSRQGKIGVLATTGTFNSERYARLMAQYGQGIMAYEDPCMGLVEEIEAGNLTTPETERILRQALTPMLSAGVDTIVLGCTHYPFVIGIIRKLVGPEVTVIDPAPAVARQTHRILRKEERLANRSEAGAVLCYSSNKPQLLASMIRDLLGLQLPVEGVTWQENRRLSLDKQNV